MKGDVNRRLFLQLSAGTGLAACATAAAGQQAQGANERIVVGVMGVNGRGRSLALSFARQPGVEIGYVCDVDSRAIAGAIGQQGSCHDQKPPDQEGDSEGMHRYRGR